MSRPRRIPSILSLIIGGTVLLGGAPAALGATARPSVRLIATQTTVVARRYDTGPAYLDPGVLVAAAGGSFELRARRADYDSGLAVTQHVARTGGTEVLPLPSWAARDFRGLPDFFKIRVSDADGAVVASGSRRFCPEGGDARVNPNGPQEPTYPRMCGSGPFTLGSVWGIARGWAVSAFGWSGLRLNIPDGRYTIRIAIARRYADLFGVSPDRAAVSMVLRVKTDEFPCEEICIEGGMTEPPGAGSPDGRPTAPIRTRGPLGQARTLAEPAADTLPDLVALPAWSIQLNRYGDREYLEFAATVWNAGSGQLLVEGYRRSGTDVMDAYQYFMRGDEVVGRAPAGTMRFDDRAGHQHWHFQQFASYSLVDASGDQVFVSRKEAFCLAPTDAIDLTIPGADWAPGSTGLGTACGGRDAIWVRETLQSGWGDTYFQSVPGQSLNVTGLPNGTYYIAVEADPRGLLREATEGNNRELREVTISGAPGHRQVTVAPWHGIDA